MKNIIILVLLMAAQCNASWFSSDDYKDRWHSGIVGGGDFTNLKCVGAAGSEGLHTESTTASSQGRRALAA